MPRQARHDEEERSDSGFTLVELMVALAIFGLLSAAGVTLLGGSVRAQESTKRHLERVETVGRLATIIGHDLALAVPRPVVGQGNTGKALEAERGRSLSFTRGGPPLGTERVQLVLDNGRLLRRSRIPAEAVRPTEEVLATDVSSLTVRTRVKGEWAEGWDVTDPAALPDALELVIQLPGGPLRLVNVVGAPQ